MKKKKIDFMLTAFRDGFQSIYGARVFTKDFIHVVEAARDAGIEHFEAGGGARFQAPYFYCNEDAFNMMDKFREAAGPSANLQTLSRGISVVALKAQPKDIINLHAVLFKKHGMTTIRNFDALNDIENLVYSSECIRKAGLKHEVCITLMDLPPGCKGAHDVEFYLNTLKKILNLGVLYDSICFKDASGTSHPRKIYETIKETRKLLGKDVRIVMHSHETAGVSIQQYMSAIEAGADQIDLSLAPVSGGTSQIDLLIMDHVLKNTEYDLDIDSKKVNELSFIFREAMQDYFLPPEALTVDPQIILSALPGGALTANTQMMRDNDLMDKYPAVLNEMRNVISKGGFGTSVTPVSQFYFQQAFNNIIFGNWKKIADGYGKMVLGYFGKTPIEPDPEIKKICAEKLNLEPTTENPLDIADRDPNMGAEAAKKILEENSLPVTDENIFIIASCEEKGLMFLKGEMSANVRKISTDKPSANKQSKKDNEKTKKNEDYRVKINNNEYIVKLDGDVAYVNNKSYNISVDKVDTSSSQITHSKPTHPSAKQLVSVTAPLPGLVLKIPVNIGDIISEGDVLIILEAMKMESPIEAQHSGVVTNIKVKQGEQVESEQVLLEIS